MNSPSIHRHHKAVCVSTGAEQGSRVSPYSQGATILVAWWPQQRTHGVVFATQTEPGTEAACFLDMAKTQEPGSPFQL